MKSLKAKSKTLTIRLPPQLYSAIQDMAKRGDVSLNTLVQESLATTIREANEKSRYDTYTLLGQDVEGCDLAYAAAAQAEVMLVDQT
jgi:hypothetical protein